MNINNKILYDILKNKIEYDVSAAELNSVISGSLLDGDLSELQPDAVKDLVDNVRRLKEKMAEIHEKEIMPSIGAIESWLMEVVKTSQIMTQNHTKTNARIDGLFKTNTDTTRFLDFIEVMRTGPEKIGDHIVDIDTKYLETKRFLEKRSKIAMSDRFMEFLPMYLIDGYSQQDIAMLLEVSQGTVSNMSKNLRENLVGSVSLVLRIWEEIDKVFPSRNGKDSCHQNEKEFIFNRWPIDRDGVQIETGGDILVSIYTEETKVAAFKFKIFETLHRFPEFNAGEECWVSRAYDDPKYRVDGVERNLGDMQEMLVIPRDFEDVSQAWFWRGLGYSVENHLGDGIDNGFEVVDKYFSTISHLVWSGDPISNVKTEVDEAIPLSILCWLDGETTIHPPLDLLLIDPGHLSGGNLFYPSFTEPLPSLPEVLSLSVEGIQRLSMWYEKHVLSSDHENTEISNRIKKLSLDLMGGILPGA